MQNEAQGVEIVFFVIFYGLLLLFSLAIQLLISFLLYRCAKSLPEQYRSSVSPGQAFFLLIPLFNLVWLFIYPKQLSQAFQSFFASINQQSDDCGEQMGLYWAICAVCSLIPCVGVLAGIGGLVCMIIYLIKVNECKGLADKFAVSPMPGGMAGGPTDDNPYSSP